MDGRRRRGHAQLAHVAEAHRREGRSFLVLAASSLATWRFGCDPPGFRPHRCSSDLIEAVKQQIDECEQLVDRVCDRDRGLALYHSGQCDVHLVGMWLDVNVRSLVYVVYPPPRGSLRDCRLRSSRSWERALSCAAFVPNNTARARASFPSAPRDRPQPPPPVAPCRSRARQASATHCEIVLGSGPVERHPLARHQIRKEPSALDRQKQRAVVAELMPLTIERASFLL